MSMRIDIAESGILCQAVSDNEPRIAGGYNPVMTIGSRICTARTRVGINKSELARRVGVSPTTAIEWEKGTKRPSVGNLEKLAVVTGVAFEWLSTGRGDMFFADTSQAYRIAESSSQRYEALSPDEALILKAFRRLSDEKKNALLELLK